jgi:hypothetical protein
MKSDTCEDSSPPSAKRMTSSTHADLVQTSRESRVTRSHSAPLVKEVPTAASEWGRGQKPEHPHNGRSIKDNLRTCIAALDMSNDTFTLPLGGGSRSTLQQNFVALSTFLHEAIKYIAYLGMEKGGVTLSVRRSTSVSQTNGILRHECHRISIIHCILVTTMCHQWKSAARLSQNFHYSIILATRMSHQWKSVAQMSQNFIIHCLSVTTMSHQAKSVARMSQNFHYIPYLGM